MLVNDVRIVDEKVPAVPVGEKYRFRLRSTVTAVIMGANNNPALVRRLSKSLIAIDMLSHSMEQLDDAGDIALRAPDLQPDLVIALSGQ